MKIVCAYLFLFVLGFTILIAADLIVGIRFPQAIDILIHTLAIKTPIEDILIPLALLAPLFSPIASLIRHHKKTKSNQ